MVATACSGETLTVGENDASTASDVGTGDVATKDAGSTDTGVADVGSTDSGTADTGPTDTGSTDAGSTDTGSTDVSTIDVGIADAETDADVGSTDAGTTDSGVSDVPTDVRVPPTSGTLQVNMVGNPTNARVTVVGLAPVTFSQSLEASTTLTGVVFGTYRLTAPTAIFGGQSYVAMPATVDAQVTAEESPSVTFAYTAMNNPPTINIVADQTLYVNAQTPTLVPFTVNDVEDGPAGLVPAAVSSDTNMVTVGVTSSSSGWVLSLLPGRTAGAATVTISVTDSLGRPTTLVVRVIVSAEAVVTTNADTGVGSLRAVIGAVRPGATVTFAPSVVSPIRLNSTIRVTNPIIIQGPGADVLTIDGHDDVQMLQVTVPLTVSGLTFSHGYSGSFGAAIQAPNMGTPLTVRDCTFDANVSGMLGGAIYANSNLSLSRSLFTANRSNSGGAVQAQGPVNTITGCTFRSNVANLFAGAVQAYAATQHTISDCAFVSNSATAGGAISVNGNNCIVAINNCTLATNTASFAGGAIVINGTGALVSMSFSTVTGSSGSSALNATTGGYRIKNSIVAGNANGDLSAVGEFISGGRNIIGVTRGTSYSGPDVGVGDDQTGVTIALDPVSSYGGLTPTVRLPAGSIALDVIPAAECTTYAGPLATDQRGRARPANTRCDVGAFERQSTD